MTKNKKRNNIKLIKKLVGNAADKIKPDKIILFGSYAYGSPNKYSDVDLLFIKNTKLSMMKRHCFVSSNIDHILPMDILVKTPSEVNKRLKMGDIFYKEILTKGKVLY